MLHNRDVEKKLRQCLHERDYDAWIIHNTFPAMSPCVYELALQQAVPIIHYMHNYRAGCLNGVFHRGDSPCFSCNQGNYLPGVLHRCWRGSATASMLAAAALSKTRRMEVWNRLSRYIAVSRRQKELLVQSGIPEDRLKVIPHYIRESPLPVPTQSRRDVLYTGRLTREKGVLQLLQAWKTLSPENRTLYVMGDGPLRRELENYIAAHRLRSVCLTGFVPHEKQGSIRSSCGLSVAPSLWEETFGMVVLESWLHASPIVVSPCGGLPELVTHGQNGWIAEEPSPDGLAKALNTAFTEEERWPVMGMHGQSLLSTRYSSSAWLQSISEVFKELSILH
ncbi:MAG: glycosyltransferase family 4 protein [Akkermansiaceae bacterium]|nr:glycosyltransferase family 4 protein [Akkermansiaceae bacterium]